MRSIEDKGCLNLGSPAAHGGGSSFEFQKGNRGGHRTTSLGKPTPSKWDDAQKWLVNLSRGIDIKSHSNTNTNTNTNTTTEPRDSNADDRRLIAPLPKKDYPTSSEDEEEEQAGDVIETKKIDFGDSIRSICVRDMGTEMTPMASQEPSRSATPVRATTLAARSPMASGSSTPARPSPNAMVAPRVDVSGTTRFGLENEVISNGEDVVENRNTRQDSKLNPLETRALAWDEAERAKYMARFKREEVKIQAWENHEKRKAEMEMKRMEAKAERMKSRAQEKYMNKLASTRRIAEEKRAKAEAVLNEKDIKTRERADYIRRTGHLPSSFSIWCCW